MPAPELNSSRAIDDRHTTCYERRSGGCWSVIEPAIRVGETYALPRDMTRAEALDYWFGPDRETFVARIDGGSIIGTYYLRSNQAGGGSHVANCGYMTHASAQGKGIARAMCKHSLARAKELGFLSMQFVVSTNEPAVKLWLSMSFREVGRLPLAFRRPNGEFVDALVLSKAL